MTKKEFDQIVRKQFQSSLFYRDTPYFKTDYAITLQQELEKERVLGDFARELSIYQGGPHKGLYKMCSVASSARLAYLYFKKAVENGGDGSCFECNLQIYDDQGKPIKGAVAHPDVYISREKTYYECKCHEIFDNKNVILSRKYQSRLLTEELIEKDNQIEGEDRIILSCRLLGIDKNGHLGELQKWKIDVKQMICHLLGIKDAVNGAQVKLKYVFFRPESDDEAIKKIYEVIENEFNEIINGDNSTISKWLKSNKIEVLLEVNKMIDPKGKEESFILRKLKPAKTF